MLVDRVLARASMLAPDAAIRLGGRMQTRLLKATNGRLGGRYGRGRVLLLTTTGRRSGQRRTTTILYGVDGDRLVVIGSNTGSERQPAWALNLLTNPEAEVRVGGTRRRVRAHVAEGEERARLWQLMSRHYEGFDLYSARTGRDIKVFRLDPA